MQVDVQQARTRRLAIVAASVVAPLAAVLFSLSQGGSWLLPALVAGVCATLVLVELGERYATPANAERR
jgi:hypothetical protein